MKRFSLSTDIGTTLAIAVAVVAGLARLTAGDESNPWSVCRVNPWSVCKVKLPSKPEPAVEPAQCVEVPTWVRQGRRWVLQMAPSCQQSPAKAEQPKVQSEPMVVPPVTQEQLFPPQPLLQWGSS